LQVLAAAAFDTPRLNINRCPMLKFIARYGIIGGLIVATPMVWLMLTAEPGKNPLGGMLVSYLIMIVALTTVFLGIKQYRDQVRGGVIKFGPAFLVGLGISFVASLFYVAGWEFSITFSKFDFVAWYSNLLLESAKSSGASASELAKAAADVQSFQTMYANPLLRMSMTFIEIFPVGVLISLISAALLRNSGLLPARAAARSDAMG